MTNIKERLHHSGLRVTPVRTEVLDFFSKQQRALSHADIEEFYKNKFDRVTLYRTLGTFIENGILHKVSDSSAVAKFALCQHDDCSKHKHEDNHVHFKCTKCNKIECLHELIIPDFKLPPNYSMQAANLLIDGTCAACN